MDATSIIGSSPAAAGRQSSLVHAEELAIDDAAPKTLTAALRATAEKFPAKGIHFIRREGGEKFISYPDLLAAAARVCAGLAASGLAPGDKIILQLDTLEAHYSAFWGCLLRGVVPVTVAVAPTYKERNGIVNKLYNTWLLLNHPAIVTTARLQNSIAELATLLPMSALKIISIDDLPSSSPALPAHESAPEDVAFIQLSSGSTGVPKCIQETHRGVIAHVHSSRRFNRYSADDVTLNWLPVDHVVPLLTFHLKDTCLGCEQIHVPTDLVLAEPLLWLDLIEKYRVTHTWSPNFGFKLVSDRLSRAEKKSRDLSSVKFFMNAGEQVTLPVVREFLTAVKPFGVPEMAMQPAFGMAEVCTCMTYANHFSLETGARRFLKSSLTGRLQPVTNGATEVIEFVSLGGVSPGISIRIADAQNQLLPEGVIGRLQIKGPVVTPGYFNNPDANREAFVGDGWFNTGDLGFVWDAELFLTGREKETIIVRGAKFYCYEVEDVVNAVAGVEPTFVAACGVSDATTGTESLAIFFVAQNGANESSLAQDVRRHVAVRLGITPGSVVPLPKTKFPKTTSGKIQRTQLKKSLEAGEFAETLQRLNGASGAGSRAPENPIEERLVEIWQEVLGRTGLSVSSHLFESGGDSLKAVQIISRVREQWRVEFPLPLLFDGVATIEAMAQWLAQNHGREKRVIPSLQPVSRDEKLPLSASQLRIWLAEQIDPGTPAYNICRALTLKGPLDTSALERALAEIIRRHEILRTIYRLEDLPVQEILPTMPLPLPRHDLMHLASPERRRVAANLVAMDASRPFDLATGPLWRAKLIRLASDEHQLALIFHQIVIDAWSLGLFFRELAELYSAFAAGRDNPLPPLPVQYADFAVWQQQWFSDSALEPQLSYWKRKLADPSRPLSFKRNPASRMWSEGRNRGPESFAALDPNAGSIQTLALKNPLLQKIQAFNAAEGVTLYMTLLATWKLLLHTWTGETDLSVGSPESGRRRLETEKLLGYFVNMLVLRTQISSGETFREILAHVRQTALEAFAHADVPFEKLLQSIPSNGGGGHSRFFQVWFGPIDSLQPFRMGELQASPQILFPATAQFDLSLFISEQPGEVTCFFEYKKQALATAQVTELIQLYERLLQTVIASPHVPVRELPGGPGGNGGGTKLNARRDVAAQETTTSLSATS